MHILKNVIFQASLTKDCEAEEMNVQKKRLESTLRIFILLITRYEQNISVLLSLYAPISEQKWNKA